MPYLSKRGKASAIFAYASSSVSKLEVYSAASFYGSVSRDSSVEVGGLRVTCSINLTGA